MKRFFFAVPVKERLAQASVSDQIAIERGRNLANSIRMDKVLGAKIAILQEGYEDSRLDVVVDRLLEVLHK